MARKARVKSSTGIYHVLVRAISDISLFTDSEDTTFYLDSLRSLQDKGFCTIYAYALFPTHVHLLIKEGNSSLLTPHSSLEPIGSSMKRLASTYSYYFNVKYDHYGPIYLDRFKSEPIEDLSTFLACRDFITTQSTDTKGIISNVIPFSSESIENNHLSFITNHSSEVVINHQSSIVSGHQSFIDFVPRRARITDSRLLDYLQTHFSYTTIDDFLQRSDSDIRTTILAAKSVGGSVRQITRLTGVPYQSVFCTR